jgi:hypothetical protein
MATIVLQAAGSFLGGYLGTFGAALGSAAGAMGGYLIDRALINGTQRIEGPRLSAMRPFQAEEGVPLPQVYGTARIGGNLIWATRFEEQSRTERQGGKGGGAKTTTYSYFANAAFALCEGPIAGVRRIWADGREIDRERFDIRIYTGSETQSADPLIAARQTHAPAYRGVAYVVFDRFPVADYGNRLPQFQFEVICPVGAYQKDVRAVCLIPGSTEYGLSPMEITRGRAGQAEAVNRHVLHAGSDLEASLDELQAVFPNLKHVALVVTWFGDDLRAGNCRIRPGVTQNDAAGFSQVWTVSGVARPAAYRVSQTGNAAAYGGTPSDGSVIDAIIEIRRRGLNVTLYPFIMMDVPAGNSLPDPYGGASQPPYPWRGRITCHPAAGQPGTPDKTMAARAAVENFVGAVAPGDVVAAARGAECLRPHDWGYRRLVLHYARLAQQAGGVDAFLLGSELRGLTTLRDGANRFPFVETLCALAGEVASILPGTRISYGADWSEYFGHQPSDGSGDVFFHLDALWAHPAIAAIGIDNYMPLSDWRDGDENGGNPDGFNAACDRQGLLAGVTRGEGYDYFYASLQDRLERRRTPISDGAYGKDWVFRYKDIRSWWENRHFNRIGGVELAEPTAWVPRSKPIWMTEIGCPAIDKGANQPNVFPDPKSSENAAPYVSDGSRDDVAPARYLEAHHAAWQPENLRFDERENPETGIGGTRMVDPDRLYVWAWDARPFPAFPTFGSVWADGGNWLLGHWLNGRASGVDVAALIQEIMERHGLAEPDVRDVHRTVAGYVVDEPGTARAALQPIVELFGLVVMERGGRVTFRNPEVLGTLVDLHELADEGGVIMETTTEAATQIAGEVELAYRDPLLDYQGAQQRAVSHGGSSDNRARLSFPGMLEQGQAAALAGEWLDRHARGREVISFSIVPERAGAGDVIRLPERRGDRLYRIETVEEGLAARIVARRISLRSRLGWQPTPPPERQPPLIPGPPEILLLDLPMGPDSDDPLAHFRVAATARPWRSHVLYLIAGDGVAPRAQIDRPARIGRLLDNAPAGRSGLVDMAGVLRVEMGAGSLQSVTIADLLNGANAAALQAIDGNWEIVQFAHAEEVEPGHWHLSRLLRGQLGTEDVLAAGAMAGANFVMLDGALAPAGLRPGEVGREFDWRCGPAGYDLSDRYATSLRAAGGLRALLPLSPVHLRGRRNPAGDLEFSWIRRGRIDADSWLASEIPLGEDEERYLAQLGDDAGVFASAELVEPRWNVPAALVAGHGQFVLRVSQMSRAVGQGGTASRSFNFTN